MACNSCSSIDIRAETEAMSVTIVYGDRCGQLGEEAYVKNNFADRNVLATIKITRGGAAGPGVTRTKKRVGAGQRVYVGCTTSSGSGSLTTYAFSVETYEHAP
ncbi:hypothetical protein GCM10007923_55510 [Shinella yambaruensis]|uniref:Uncharacterized protein n=1 Tax=Shinella yambaruensis TaxID=415996 RepID=A0ABQ5ZRG9_9HYPH|nr:hypothetical protein GCM10007923_55510 [Shinella yambaruensis]